MFKNDRQAAFALIAQCAQDTAKAIKASSSKADVMAFAKANGKANAAKACAKAGIPLAVAKAWIL